ncbi:MAG: oligopeptide/dipeptide ABC transporter ATP-binding protein [Pseudomonadota bacterium]
MTLLSIRSLWVNARRNLTAEHSLQDLNLDLQVGERLALVGGRDQGPSLLLSVLAEPVQARSGVAAGSIWLELPGEGRLTLWRLLSTQKTAILALDLEDLAHRPRAAFKSINRDAKVSLSGVLDAKRTGPLRSVELVTTSLALIKAVSPKILLLRDPPIADPILWAGFANGIREISASGTAVIFQTSDLVRAAEICERSLVFYAGRVVEDGIATDLRDLPKHPLTGLLGKCLPEAVMAKTAFPVDKVGPPLPASVSKGCPFHPRCANALAGCYVELPELVGTSSHRWACHRPLGSAR